MTIPTSMPSPRAPSSGRRANRLAAVPTSALLAFFLAVAPAAFAHEDDAEAATESAAAETPVEAAPGDDFPTAVIADYVLGCMAANGNSYESLQQCSCSIDFIKARMDYKSYEAAGTILQVQRDVGQRGIFYRDSNWAKSRVERLEALQAESTLRCF